MDFDNVVKVFMATWDLVNLFGVFMFMHWLLPILYPDALPYIIHFEHSFLQFLEKTSLVMNNTMSSMMNHILTFVKTDFFLVLIYLLLFAIVKTWLDNSKIRKRVQHLEDEADHHWIQTIAGEAKDDMIRRLGRENSIWKHSTSSRAVQQKDQLISRLRTDNRAKDAELKEYRSTYDYIDRENARIEQRTADIEAYAPERDRKDDELRQREADVTAREQTVEETIRTAEEEKRQTVSQCNEEKAFLQKGHDKAFADLKAQYWQHEKDVSSGRIISPTEYGRLEWRFDFYKMHIQSVRRNFDAAMRAIGQENIDLQNDMDELKAKNERLQSKMNDLNDYRYNLTVERVNRSLRTSLREEEKRNRSLAEKIAGYKGTIRSKNEEIAKQHARQLRAKEFSERNVMDWRRHSDELNRKIRKLEQINVDQAKDLNQKIEGKDQELRKALKGKVQATKLVETAQKMIQDLITHNNKTQADHEKDMETKEKEVQKAKTLSRGKRSHVPYVRVRFVRGDRAAAGKKSTADENKVASEWSETNSEITETDLLPDTDSDFSDDSSHESVPIPTIVASPPRPSAPILPAAQDGVNIHEPAQGPQVHIPATTQHATLPGLIVPIPPTVGDAIASEVPAAGPSAPETDEGAAGEKGEEVGEDEYEYDSLFDEKDDEEKAEEKTDEKTEAKGEGKGEEVGEDEYEYNSLFDGKDGEEKTEEKGGEKGEGEGEEEGKEEENDKDSLYDA